MAGTEPVPGTIALMAVATYLTRVAGVWLVALAPMTPRLDRTLHHLSGSVLAALVAPALAGGDLARCAGVVAACAVMASTRSAPFALLAGLTVTALARL